MYSVMRHLVSADHLFIEYLSLDSANRVFWTRFGPQITAFNDLELAQTWVNKLNLDYGCGVCQVAPGPESNLAY